MSKRIARVNSDYWLLVSEEQPNKWTVQIWGPTPLQHDGIHQSAQEAEAAAIEVAREHFRSLGLPIEVPDRLRWSLAMAQS